MLEDELHLQTRIAHLQERAALHKGTLDGRSLAGGATFHRPGDPLGTVLCETWLIDPGLACEASALTATCEVIRTLIEYPTMRFENASLIAQR